MKKAVAENAEILEDDGLTITYHPRCPMCGVIGEVTDTIRVEEGKTETVKDFTCPYCGMAFDITFTR